MIVLSGRFAGRKAVIVKTFEEGSTEHKFPHALIAGIDSYPRRVTRSMGQKRVLRRSRIKPFVKFINFNHIMPTRYSLTDLDLKNVVKPESFKKPGDARVEAKKEVKKLFQERYLAKTKQTGGATFFFQKLRF